MEFRGEFGCKVNKSLLARLDTGLEQAAAATLMDHRSIQC